jgi:hypothetical protein
LSYAKGSAGEVRSQLYRARLFDIFAESDELTKRYARLSAGLMNLIRSIQKSDVKGQKFLNR